MIKFAVDYDGPIAVRYPRGEAYTGLKEFRAPICLGKSEVIHEGSRVALLAVGSMVKMAEELSKPFPHVRVDFYNISGNIIFGELTFFNASGYVEFEPDSFDKEMGNQFNLRTYKGE